MKLAGSPMLLEWFVLPLQCFDDCTRISNYHLDEGESCLHFNVIELS